MIIQFKQASASAHRAALNQSFSCSLPTCSVQRQSGSITKMPCTTERVLLSSPFSSPLLSSPAVTPPDSLSVSLLLLCKGLQKCMPRQRKGQKLRFSLSWLNGLLQCGCCIKKLLPFPSFLKEKSDHFSALEII